MEYYSDKRSKVLIHATTWIKKPDTKGRVLYDFIYMNYPEQINPYRQNMDWWLPGAVGGGNGEKLLNGKWSDAEVMNVWELDRRGGNTTL